MAAKPWMDSTDLVSAIKRKILVPISQNTFSENDLLAFLNEEMMISQVPSVLQFHEEYYVMRKTVPLVANQTRYPIPDRAIGMRLREVFYLDDANNLGEMTRVQPEDRAYFQRNLGSSQPVTQFLLENNELILLPNVDSIPTGSLVFHFFIRPNQLVTVDRAATITFFNENLTVDNAFLVAGDTLTIQDHIVVQTLQPDGTYQPSNQIVDIVFTAVSGAPGANEFQIGATSVITATNLVTSINTNGICIADNGSPSTAMIKLKFTSLADTQGIEVSNPLGLILQDGQAIEFNTIPTVIDNNLSVDFLQTKPGHKIRTYDVVIPSNSISGTQINFDVQDIPTDLVVGDYICLSNECIIPFLPPDMHTGLAERACARILAAIGDQAGLQIANTKIQEIEGRQATLLDNRAEGNVQKIANHHGLLTYGIMGPRRRTY